MESEGGAHGGQVPRTSPAEGGGEGARPQKTRKRRSWTAEEDAVLAAHVRVHGVGKWDTVPKSTGLARTGQSCRFRWLNSLLPGLKEGVAFSRDEELHLCRLHAALGNKWSRIAAEMEGRSENEVRHYWFYYVDRCQKAGLNVYPPEVQQAAAGQSDLYQPQLKRHKSQTSSLPQQPPPPPYQLPVGYPNYPVVPTHLPQPLGVVYPVTMAIAPPPLLPVMAEEAKSNSQFWMSFMSLSNQNVEQGMQGNTTESNENDRRRMASLLELLDQNDEQGRQTQPPALPSGDATEFTEENQLSASLLQQSNQNVGQKMQPQTPALPLENPTEFIEEGRRLLLPLLWQSTQNIEQRSQPQPPALPTENTTEFNEEGQPLKSLPPLSDQNVEQGRQPQPPALPKENTTECNEEVQPMTSLPPLPDQNVEQERQSPALPLENATELNEEGLPLTSLPPLSYQNVEQGMQTPSPALSLGYTIEFSDGEFWGVCLES